MTKRNHQEVQEAVVPGGLNSAQEHAKLRWVVDQRQDRLAHGDVRDGTVAAAGFRVARSRKQQHQPIVQFSCSQQDMCPARTAVLAYMSPSDFFIVLSYNRLAFPLIAHERHLLGGQRVSNQVRALHVALELCGPTFFMALSQFQARFGFDLASKLLG